MTWDIYLRVIDIQEMTLKHVIQTALAAAAVGLFAAPALAQTVVTDGQGRAYTVDLSENRDVVRSYDTETGLDTIRNRDTRRGNVVTSQGQISCNSAGQCFRDGQYVGPRSGMGQSATGLVYSPDGSLSGGTVAVRPDGTIVTRDRVSVPTPDGRSGTLRRDGRMGPAVRYYERAYAREDGFRRSATTTGPNGNTIATEGTASCLDGTCLRDGLKVGPRGNTRVVQGDSRRLAPGERAGSRTVTGPDPRSRTRERNWKRVRR